MVGAIINAIFVPLWPLGIVFPIVATIVLFYQNRRDIIFNIPLISAGIWFLAQVITLRDVFFPTIFGDRSGPTMLNGLDVSLERLVILGTVMSMLVVLVLSALSTWVTHKLLKKILLKSEKDVFMEIRPITKSDYIRLNEAGGYAQNYGQNVQRWLAKGFVVESDCYVFINGGVPIGGVCFCDDTEEAREILDFALVDIPSNGHEYLTEAIRQATKPGTRKISYNLYNDTEQYAQLQKLFRKAGFIVEQEKLRYLYKGAIPPTCPQSLRFKTVAEIGEELFVEMVEIVTADTLDGLMAADALRLGARKAAQEYVDGLKQLDFNPDWWRLGYVGDTAVGLILPQRFDEKVGCINYVGVVPEHRGKGYGLPLLAEGTRILIENGVTEIIADIDKANRPLAAQLMQLGYVFQMDEVVLACHI